MRAEELNDSCEGEYEARDKDEGPGGHNGVQQEAVPVPS